MTDAQDLPASCPFCSAQPYLADPTNFPNDWEHPWDHKGCFLDGFHITDHTAWNRRSTPVRAEMQGQPAATQSDIVDRLLEAAEWGGMGLPALYREAAHYIKHLRTTRP